MTNYQTQRLFTLISGLWVGSFIAIGFLVVPILFTSLGDRQLAGMIAASLFRFTADAGVVISAFLMLMANHFVSGGHQRFRSVRWILLVMLTCTVGAAFIIIPWMNSLRDQALMAGLSVRESSNAPLFGRLHVVSSVLFLLQSVLGVALVWRATKNAD